MKTDKLTQAERLYFQTELSASEIAEAVGVPRRTIHYWINHESWDRMKISANAMPCLLQENCYALLGKVTNDCLAPGREHDRVQTEEVNNITKLSQVIARLGKRITLNESFEIRNNMLEYVFKRNPDLALELEPIIDQYLKEKAKIQPHNFMGKKTTENGMLTPKDPEVKLRETQLDIQDNFYWHDNPPYPETNPEIFEPLYASSPLYADLRKADHTTQTTPHVGPVKEQPESMIGATNQTKVNINDIPNKEIIDGFIIHLISKKYPTIQIEGQPTIPDLSSIPTQLLNQEFKEYLTAHPEIREKHTTSQGHRTETAAKTLLNRAQRRALEKQNKKAAKKTPIIARRA